MHPSVFATDSSHRPRRVAKKRGRRASCTAAIQSAPDPLSMAYTIPTLKTAGRRASCTGSSHFKTGSGHCSMQRRNSNASTASLSDSYSSTSSMNSARSCSFREDPEIISIQTATSLVNNPNELWFSKDDFETFRDKTRRIINGVDDKGRGKNGKKYCTRGLEIYTAQAQESRRRIRKSILQALEENKSATLLGGFTKNSVAGALQLAQSDARAACGIYKKCVPGNRRASVG